MPGTKKKNPKGKIIDAVEDYRALARKLKKPPLAGLTFANLKTVTDVLKKFKKTHPDAWKQKACWAHAKWGA